MLDQSRITDIKNVLLSLGELPKDDIVRLWELDEDDYAALKRAFDDEKLIEPGTRGRGGFVVRVRKRPLPADDEGAQPFVLAHAWEELAVARLAELFSYADLEKLLGDLVYTVRRARTHMTGEDRRGTKRELAAALVIQHSVDLFTERDLRAAVARKCAVDAPERWIPGKGSAAEFTHATQFPPEFAGIPSPDAAPEFEYLEGRIELSALADFQLEVQQAMRKVLEARAARAIVTLPTGAGKTRVAVDTLRDWLTRRAAEPAAGDPGQVVLWLAHTEELCEQAYMCFRQVWQASPQVCPLQLFRYWGRYNRDFNRHQEALFGVRERASCLISTPQRLLKLIDAQPGSTAALFRDTLQDTVRAIVVDEAHRAAAPSYLRILERFEAAASGAAVIGLTATPFRGAYLNGEDSGGTRELKSIFRRIIEPARTLGEDPRAELQRRGYLAEPLWDAVATQTLLKPPPLADVAALNEDDIERIDYALKKRADNPARRMAVLERMLEICAEPGTKLIYFGPSVLDAECMALLLRLRGVSSAFVSGATREVTRRQIVEDFKQGTVQVLCNCEVLTTGFDAPKVTHVVMARPTVSQVLYEQMVGRGLRGARFGGTATCVILDCDDRWREQRLALGYQAFREIWKPRRNRP